MISFKAIRKEDWIEIKKRGFWNYYFSTLLSAFFVGLGTFTIFDFIIHYDQQTPLMLSGVTTILICAPTWTAVTWFILKRRFSQGT